MTEVMDILFEESLDSAYPIFSLPSQAINRVTSSFHKLILNHIVSSKSNEFYPKHLRETFDLYRLSYQVSREVGALKMREYFSTYHQQDLITFLHYVSFRYQGSNIFEFPQHLLELFGQTDVDSVLLKDIKLPFSTIYIHFGKQEHLKISSHVCSVIDAFKSESETPVKDIQFLLDGAYISQCPDTKSLNILFTTVRNDSRDTVNRVSTNCIDSYEENSIINLEAVHPDISIAEVLDLIREMSLNNKEHAISESSYNTEIAQIIKQLKLVINCLLYLQSYPEDITEDYPESAPSNLVAKTKKNSGVKAIAEKELNQLGYRKIKLIGNKRILFPTIDDTERALTTDEDKQTKQPHRRRTHLRKQRYGKGLESWRYIWIKEAIIHKDKYEPSQQYRIYEVSQNMAPQ